MTVDSRSILAGSRWSVEPSRGAEPWVHRFIAESDDGAQCELVIDEVAKAVHLTLKRPNSGQDTYEREGLDELRLVDGSVACDFRGDAGVDG